MEVPREVTFAAFETLFSKSFNPYCDGSTSGRRRGFVAISLTVCFNPYCDGSTSGSSMIDISPKEIIQFQSLL